MCGSDRPEIDPSGSLATTNRPKLMNRHLQRTLCPIFGNKDPPSDIMHVHLSPQQIRPGRMTRRKRDAPARTAARAGSGAEDFGDPVDGTVPGTCGDHGDPGLHGRPASQSP
ncbi:hypothetical protein GCM10010156_33620 [Planobispora rosea]|uniref:Uncharacterized protein n=1 Tax=Planobispora rosea TaxID=35762 RepID=A0A8J3RY81_PLARO|nr:hypothetical protein GCM10010156_33620 [Planobispora rosea]GIH85226.1 hypothetical protein Pro02_36340 [Planobispora rosea]